MKSYEWGSWGRAVPPYEECMLKVDGRISYVWLIRNRDGKFFYFRRDPSAAYFMEEVFKVAIPLAATNDEEAKEAAIAIFRLEG